jgi:4-hydroxy-tetrahydrodipicolinate synthase
MTSEVTRESLRTVHLVPLTAMDTSGKLNLDAQRQHISRMAEAGMKVYLPAAGTSEFHSLGVEEIAALVKVTREAAGPDAVIFAPVGLQVDFAIEVGRQSLEAGASGIMFMPFTHPYLSDAGAKDYYRAVIGELRCPTMFYKKDVIPSDDLLLQLVADARVVGVKYAVNQMHQFRTVVATDLKRKPGGSTEWLCGSAERFAPFYMLAGSPGYTTGAGNICPRLTLAMHAAFTRGDYAEGMRLQEIILPIENYRARQGDSYNISMLKHGMNVLGHDFGPPRPPQRRLTSEEKTEIETLLEPIIEEERNLGG